MTTSPTKAGGATPGPWLVKPSAAPMLHNGDIGIVNSKGTLIAVALFERGSAAANASLIAAAPLMLEALKTLHDKTAELIAHLQSTDRLRPCFNLPAIETARAAIAAAACAQGGTR